MSVNDLESVKKRLQEKVYEEYFGLYVTDLDTGLITVLKDSPWYPTGRTGDSAPHTEMLREFASHLDKEPQALFMKLADLDYVKRELASEDKHMFYYKSNLVTGRKWVLVTVYVIRRHDDYTPAEFFMGFSLVDSLGSSEREIQRRLRKNIEILQSMTADYSSIYYVDLVNNEILPFLTDEAARDRMIDVVRDVKVFDEVIRMWIDQSVFELDKEMMFRECNRENIISKLSGGKPYTITFRRLKDGAVSFCEMRFVAARIDSDGVIQSVGIGLAYRDNEIMAQYLNEKLISEYISAFMVDLDHDKFRTYRHPDTTTAMDREDRTWSLAMADFASECVSEYYELVKNIGSPEFLKRELADVDRREYLYRFPSASKPWRRCVILVLDREDGDPKSVIATFMGIDDYQSKIKDQQKLLAVQQKQLQEALSMAQSANRAKTAFLNNMSHDIRTPMNAIIGYTGLVAGNLDNNEKARDYLGKIGESSKHLLSLINDVLDMSRIESGKMHLDEQPENITDIVHSLRDMVHVDLHNKQHDFFIEMSRVTDEYVICDRLRLNQILINILSNAIKYTAPGGSILMRVTEKGVKNTGYGTYEFFVKDNGMGMSHDYIKTLFEPFSRAKTTTASGVEGTGLGMAITKNLIDMMGGKIDVSSELGKGTEITVTFDFRLLTAEDMKSEDDAPVNGMLDLRGRTILLVEDNDTNREIAISILEDFGCRIVCAEDGDIAVDMMKKASAGDYDMVLMDIQMPRMDGYEATRQIRALGTEISRIPIVAMTANAFEEDRKAAFESGMNEHIAKPIDLAVLTAVLDHYIGSK